MALRDGFLYLQRVGATLHWGTGLLCSGFSCCSSYRLVGPGLGCSEVCEIEPVSPVTAGSSQPLAHQGNPK